MEEIYNLSENVKFINIISKVENVKLSDDIFELNYSTDGIEYSMYIPRELLNYIFKDNMLQVITLGVPISYGPIEFKIEKDEKIILDKISNLLLPGINIDIDLNENIINLYQYIKVEPNNSSIGISIRSKLFIENSKYPFVGKEIELFNEYLSIDMKDIFEFINTLSEKLI